jgi:D-xylose reductase
VQSTLQIDADKLQGWWQKDGSETPLDRVPTRETWEALEQLVDEGIAKSIGVSNHSSQSLYDIQTYARHPISSLQVEHHPYLTQAQLILFAQEHGIVVTAYSSFGPQSFIELSEGWGKRSTTVKSLFETDPVKKAAEAHGKTPAQILLRWATQRNIAVIPKSNNKDRLAQNLDVLSFDLSKEEIEELSALNLNFRLNDPGQNLETNPLRIFA